MAITRLKNIFSSNTGRILYVNPDDFDASDSISNRGNSPLRPFKTLQRALLEAARFSYVPGNGGQNDKFDSFTIMLYPGDHVIDNRPGVSDVNNSPVLSDTSNFNLNDPTNDLYKFNSTRGGVVVPRGTSVVGLDLRKTKIIPKFIPNPLAVDGGTIKSNYPNTGVLNSGSKVIDDDTRTAIFRVTGGCYFWQFTIFDGDKNGVYTGSPTPSGVPNTLVTPSFSHHKLTNFEYACFYDLSLYYQKASKAFSAVGIPATDPLAQRTEENRIVGPGGIQADTNRISTITYNANIATATTVNINNPGIRYAHGFSIGSQIRVFDSDDAISGVSYNGTYQIISVGSSLNDDLYDQFSYQLSGIPNNNAQKLSTADYIACELETDTVDSASPYIFNLSIRSIYGICGMHANGALATGFKSMVVAQYTGISLQKDVRAYVRRCGGTDANPVYQDGEINTCGTTKLKPANQDITAQYKKGWRNYHIKASNDGYIQVVSVFAVGMADQFIVDSGGDMSIANSNSNFGNTALRAKGFKTVAFTKDIYGVVTHLIPPRNLPTTETPINWVSFDVNLTKNATFNPSGTKLFIFGATSLANPPSATVLGYTVGARTNDVLYVSIGNTLCSAVVNPSGVATKSAAVNTAGNPLKWDSSANNWFIQVNSSGNTIYSNILGLPSSQVTTPVSYFTRIIDSRVPNDTIYRLRLFVDRTKTNASPPQAGFVLQPLGGNTEYTNTYYIFEVEEYQKFIAGTQDGIYYLTVLLGNISPTASNFNDTKFSQNVNQLYPTEDIDNPVSDAVSAKSIANNLVIGLVSTTDGTNEVTDRSITRETAIQWCKETNNNYTLVDNSGTYDYFNPLYTLTVNGTSISSKNNDPESRKILLTNNIPSGRPVAGVAVELRRPSIIRAGNQTFEYTGYGPGNYSTGFPSRQTIVLTDDQIKLSQSTKENGGIAFYSGLNSNGDLFVGNQIINPVTGSTTQVDSPTTSSATDPNSPVFTNVTVTNRLNVLGGSDSNTTSIFSGPLSIAGKTTISNNLLVNPTWNNGGSGTSTFNGLEVSVVDTLSSSSSNILSLGVSNSPRLTVDKNGRTTFTTYSGAISTGILVLDNADMTSNGGPGGRFSIFNNSNGTSLECFGATQSVSQISAGSTVGISVFSTNVNIPYNTNSTNPNEGALTVNGGTGISGRLSVGGITTISNTTASSSSSTGSLVVSGGVGIGQQLYIGAGLTTTTGFFSGTVTAAGFSTVGTTGAGTITASDDINGGRITAGNNTRFAVNNAFLSSGGNDVYLANHEWWNGTSWQTTATTGAMYRIQGQTHTWFRHNGLGTQTQLMNLDASGNLTVTQDITAFSDAKFKKNVKTIKDALSKVESIRGVEYERVDTDKKSIGVIAQEIEKIIPEVVLTTEDGTKSVAYGNLVGLLIEAVKELSEKVRKLENDASN